MIELLRPWFGFEKLLQIFGIQKNCSVSPLSLLLIIAGAKQSLSMEKALSWLY